MLKVIRLWEYRRWDRWVFVFFLWSAPCFSQMTWSWQFSRTCRLPWLSELADMARFDWSTWSRLWPWWLSMGPRSFWWFWQSLTLQVSWARTWYQTPWVFSWWCPDIPGCTFLDTGGTGWRNYFIRGMAELTRAWVTRFSSGRYRQCPKAFTYGSSLIWALRVFIFMFITLLRLYSFRL